MTSELRRLGAGERVSTEAYNAVIDALERLQRGGAAAPLEVRRLPGGLGPQIGPASWPRLELVEFDEHLTAHDVDRPGKRLLYRKEEAGDKWGDGAGTLGSLADAHGSAYLAGERRLCFFHPAAGRYVPVDGSQWHLGILEANLAAGGSAPVRISHATDEGILETTLVVTAYDWLLGDEQYLELGARVIVMYQVSARRWFVTQAAGCAVEGESEA